MTKEPLKHVEHIYQQAEHSLCGYAMDEIEVEWIDDKRINRFTSKKDMEEARERIKSMYQDKTEFGSNCKECISMLRKLRSIKK